MIKTSASLWVFSLIAFLTPVVSSSQTLAVRSDHEIPAQHAFDIRWASESEVYLALGTGGVVRTPTSPTPASMKVVEPAASDGGFFYSARLGASRSRLFIGSPFGAFTWVDLKKGTRPAEPAALAVSVDADVYADRVVVLGGDRDEKGSWSPDGTLAWTGTLNGENPSLRSVFVSRDGRASTAMARCHFLEPGAVRFMRDGSYVIAPGVEPDIYHYDANGKLLRTWDSSPLNILDECPLSVDDMTRMAGDPALRYSWLATQATIDDILPLPAGPALIIRTVKGDTTTWRMVILNFDGTRREVALPIKSPSPRAHLRGDVQGGKYAFLVSDYDLPDQKPLPPRLVILEEK